MLLLVPKKEKEKSHLLLKSTIKFANMIYHTTPSPPKTNPKV